jgi:Sigma-70 region 2/Putative zinc-finger
MIGQRRTKPESLAANRRPGLVMSRSLIESVSALFSLSDEQAMWRVQMHDDAHAFAHLAGRWEGPIQRLCSRLLGDAHKGEDLAQDTFARLFAKRKEYQMSGRFSTFLWLMQNAEQTPGRDSGVVNHPSPEEWISYVYGEMSRAPKASLTAHLEICAACRTTVAAWQTAKAGLGEWQLQPSAAPRRTGAISPVLRWALAALLVLGLGYAIGRRSAVRTDRQALQAALEPALRASLADSVRQQVRQELRADWHAALGGNSQAIDTEFRRQLRADLEHWRAQTVASSRAESEELLRSVTEMYHAARQRDQQAIITLLDRAEQKQEAEHISLRRALETVAVVADDKFQRTDTELGQLASYAAAQLISDKPTKPIDPVNLRNQKGKN